MRLRLKVAVGAVSAAALIGGGLSSAFASPDAEHGHGFNCTPGNPGNAEFQHDSRGKEDHGNGEDCLRSAPVTTTTLKPATPVTPANTAVQRPAAAPTAAPT